MSASNELVIVEEALRKASVRIHTEIRNHIGWTGEEISTFCHGKVSKEKNTVTNQSGDVILALDVLADTIIEEELKACSLVAGFASEEREEFVTLNDEGKYLVVFDPLDGSQNVGVNITVGAIYGVFQAKHINEVQTGREIVAAGYAVFSTALQFAYCTREDGVSIGQYSFDDDEWVDFKKKHQMPKKGKTYAINEGNSPNWDATISTFIGQHLRGARSVRWGSCLVLDAHRQLMEGGLFAYPVDKKYPKGRLRLVYEAIPLAFIFETAGGHAYHQNLVKILDMRIPEDVHARCGIVFLGPTEHDAYLKVIQHAPTWAGGDANENLKVQMAEQEKTQAQELGALKTALVVGAIVNLFLLYRFSKTNQ